MVSRIQRGWTALDFARNNGRAAVARLLEKHDEEGGDGSLGPPHTNFSCDKCGVKPIPAGLLYQCLTCRQPVSPGFYTTYDLCSDCYDSSATGCPNGRHRMACISSVPDTPVTFVDPPSDDDSDSDGEELDGYDSAEIVIDDSSDSSEDDKEEEDEDADEGKDADSAEETDSEEEEESDGDDTYEPAFDVLDAANFHERVAAKKAHSCARKRAPHAHTTP